MLCEMYLGESIRNLDWKYPVLHSILVVSLELGVHAYPLSDCNNISLSISYSPIFFYFTYDHDLNWFDL